MYQILTEDSNSAIYAFPILQCEPDSRQLVRVKLDLTLILKQRVNKSSSTPVKSFTK